MFTITVVADYFIHEIPPRCRKARLVTHQLNAHVEIPEVSAAEAPVAFEIEPIFAERGSEHLRWHEETLYQLYLPVSRQTQPTPAGSDSFPRGRRLQSHDMAQRIPCSHYVDEAEALEALRVSFAGYLIINGDVWTACGEPAFYVATFGLGSNHGGTALMHHLVDPGQPHPAYFSALDHERAEAEAIRVALARGDTKSAQDITHRKIHVLIEDACRLPRQCTQVKRAC
jgi:hypothetical protein